MNIFAYWWYTTKEDLLLWINFFSNQIFSMQLFYIFIAIYITIRIWIHLSLQYKMSTETETETQEKQINLLLVEMEKIEKELERTEQQQQEPTEPSNGNLEEQVRKLRDHNLRVKHLNTQRRRILRLLQGKMLQYATLEERLHRIGELVLIAELHSGVKTLNQRLDRMVENSTCSICLLPWTDNGIHRLVSLRCGHLFGSSCIHMAIRRNHRCPICRRRARHFHVRRIYSPSFLSH